MSIVDVPEPAGQWPSNPESYETYEKILTRNRVWKARVHFADGPVEVTVRIITLDPSVVTDLEDIVKSLEVLRSIDHPNVLKVLHWFIDEASNTLWMVYEPNSWTSLFEILAGAEQGLEEALIAAICQQVLHVIVAVHKSGKAWYDIRPVHLLLNNDGSIQVILHSLRSILRLKTRDSLPFVSPEQLQPKQDVDTEKLFRQRFKGDIWALGVTAVSLYIAHSPYEQMSLAEITAHIQQFSPEDEIKTPLSNEFASFLDQCFRFDPDERPTAEELLRHPFILNAPGIDYIQSHLVVQDRNSDGHPTDMPDEGLVYYGQDGSLGSTPAQGALVSHHSAPGNLNAAHITQPQGQAPMATAPSVTAAMNAAAGALSSTPQLPANVPAASPITTPVTATKNPTNLAQPVPVHAAIPPVLNAAQPQQAPVYSQPVTGSQQGYPPTYLNSQPGQASGVSSPPPAQGVAAPQQPPLARGPAASPAPQNPAQGAQNVVYANLTHSTSIPKPAAAGPAVSTTHPADHHDLPQPQQQPSTTPSPAKPDKESQQQASQSQSVQSATTAPSAASQQTNVPMECFLAESKHEYVVFIRAIPNTIVKLTLEAKALHITGTLPPLNLPAEDGLVLREQPMRHFERTVNFPAAVNANSFSKGYNKTASTLTIKIRKFTPVDLGTESF